MSFGKETILEFPKVKSLLAGTMKVEEFFDYLNSLEDENMELNIFRAILPLLTADKGVQLIEAKEKAIADDFLSKIKNSADNQADIQIEIDKIDPETDEGYELLAVLIKEISRRNKAGDREASPLIIHSLRERRWPTAERRLEAYKEEKKQEAQSIQ